MTVPASRAGLRIRLSWFDLLWALSSPALAVGISAPELIAEARLPEITVFILTYAGLACAQFWCFRIRDPLPSYFATIDALALVKATTSTSLFAYAVAAIGLVPLLAPDVYIVAWLVLTSGLLAARAGGKLFFTERDLAHGNPDANFQSILLIGANGLAAGYIQLLHSSCAGGGRVVGILDPRAEVIGRLVRSVPIIAVPTDLPAVVDEFRVHGVTITRVVLCGSAQAQHAAVLDFCQRHDIPVGTISSFGGLVPLAEQVPSGAHVPTDLPDVASLRQRGKRLIDIAVASVGLFITLPLMGFISGAVLVCLGPPVVFWQERQGLHGLPFRMFKFRTLRSYACPP